MINKTLTIIKSEFPDLNKKTIIEYFKEELEGEGIKHVFMDSEEVEFRNEKFYLSFGGGKNKFRGFDKGCINVIETETSFDIKFSSSSKRTYLYFAKISLLLLILSCFVSGFSWNSIMIGIGAFLIFGFEYTIHTYLNINLYFSRFSQK